MPVKKKTFNLITVAFGFCVRSSRGIQQSALNDRQLLIRQIIVVRRTVSGSSKSATSSSNCCNLVRLCLRFVSLFSMIDDFDIMD